MSGIRRNGVRSLAAALVLVASIMVTATFAPRLATPVAGQTQDQTAGAITLVDQTTWVDPDGEIVIRMALQDLPDDATVEVTLHERMRSRSDFLATVDRERLRGRLTDPPVVVGTAADLGDTATVRIPIRSGPQDPELPPRLGIADPGVHPVDIAIYSADRAYLGGLVTHVARLPATLPLDESERLGVVLTQSLDAGISHQPDGSISLAQSVRESWTIAVSSLLANPGHPMLLSVQPETVAALAGSTSELDRALLADLVSLAETATLAATTFVDLDLDGLVRAGLGDEIPGQLELGAEVLVTEVGVVDHQTWVGDNTLTDPAISALAAAGIDRMVVPSTLVSESIARGTSSEGPGPSEDPLQAEAPIRDADDPLLGPVLLLTDEDTRVTALATDHYLQQHQGSTGDPRLDAQHALIDLAMLSFVGHSEGTTAGVLALDLTPSLAEPIDPAFVATLFAGIEESPYIEAVGLGQAIGGRPSSLPHHRLMPSTSTSDLSDLRRDLDLARLSVASFHGVFPPDELRLPNDLDFERSFAVAVSSRLLPSDRSSYFVAMAEVMDDALSGISVFARAITLPAREGTVPITLTNDSDRTATVALRLESDRLDFPLGPRIEVPLPPGSTTVEIAVRARASGAFPLDIEVESPDGRIALAASRYTVRSTAVSGVGVAISVAAIAVLGLWWVRTARRARASRAGLIDEDQPANA